MVASLYNLANAAAQNNDTVKKLVMSNKTLADSIASLQAQNLKLIQLVKKLTAAPPSLATFSNPNKYLKPPWYPTGYFWSHGYNICTR